jgi:hypothetical protein
MPTPTTELLSEEEIQFTTAPPSHAPGSTFWSPTSLSEEKMEGIEDDDGDEPFTDAKESDLDDPKRGRDISSPPKAPKKPRDSTTGAPSLNSCDAGDNEILEDADDEVTGAPNPPPDPAKVDISATPHRPRRDYTHLIQNLPQPQRTEAGTTYSAMTGDPKVSPSQVTPVVHKLLHRIHHQTLTADMSIPLHPNDRQRALVRVIKNNYQDDESQPELLSIEDADNILIYFSHLTNTDPHAFFNVPQKAQYTGGTPLTQDWAIAVAVLGCHYQSSYHTLTQQSMY